MRQLDRTKKSNIKCEHCRYWCKIGVKETPIGDYDLQGCSNPESPKYNTSTCYYNRCKVFNWKENGDEIYN